MCRHRRNKCCASFFHLRCFHVEWSVQTERGLTMARDAHILRALLALRCYILAESKMMRTWRSDAAVTCSDRGQTEEHRWCLVLANGVPINPWWMDHYPTPGCGQYITPVVLTVSQYKHVFWLWLMIGMWSICDDWWLICDVISCSI